MFEVAKALGVRAVVVDGAGSWSKGLVADGLAERFVACDMADTEGVQDFILGELRGLAAAGLPLDGVCTFSEVAVPLAARLAQALGLPGNPVDAVDCARDKHAARAAMQRAGLATPRNALLRPGASPADVAAAGAHVGFPAVLKPTGGAASIGVLRVEDAAALAQGHARVTSELARCVIDSSGTVLLQETAGEPLPPGGRRLVRLRLLAPRSRCSPPLGPPLVCLLSVWRSLCAYPPPFCLPPPSPTPHPPPFSQESPLILEEYLDGTEIDCDVVLDAGVAVYATITDNWPTIEPWFNETGDNAPSLLPAGAQTEMRALCVDSLRALGFTTGVFHVEGKQTTRGARLLEINCRMGGGQVRDNNLAVWGVDLVEQHIVTACGLPVAARAADPPLTCRSALSIVAPRSGTMGPGDWFACVRGWPNVVYARPFAKEGDHVVCAADGMPTWCGQVMCDGKTVQEAIALVRKVEATVTPPIVDTVTTPHVA